MTDAVHTPEPWHVDSFGCHNDFKLRLCEPMRSGFPLATIAQFEYNWRDAGQYERQISYKEAEANARRTAAAINALEGISTADIEAGVIAELVEALDMCRAIIKFHVKNAGVCCSFSPESKPFSALEAHNAAVNVLTKIGGAS